MFVIGVTVVAGN